MTWTLETSRGFESDKIAHLVVPYLQGRSLDIGCGQRKVWPTVLGIDNGHHFGRGGADIVGDGTDLAMFADGCMDGIFSSHFLEHVRGPLQPVLREWWRVLKPGGHLCLYLPHADLYPRMGESGANPDHQRDLLPDDVVSVMREVGDWTLLENETRDQGDEYSFFQVYRKEARHSGHVFQVWERNPRGEKRALVIRYGAFGDAMVAASIFPGLKAQGYHVTVNCKPSTQDVLRYDPHVDEWVVQGEDFVPNPQLGPYWQALAERYDRVINLSESVEGLLLTLPGRLNHAYPDDSRKILYDNINYLEHTHNIAAVPHEFAARFYPTEKELKWARACRRTMSGPVVAWAINGSSAHKVYPWTQVVAKWLVDRFGAHIVLFGDPTIGVELQAGIVECLEKSGVDMAHIHPIAGKWKIRDSLTFAQIVDCMVGPETGPLNAVCLESVPKVIYLSHSSPANLTKHWRNTTVLTPDLARAPCYPCHRLHYDWTYCHQDEKTGAAACASGVAPEAVFEAIALALGARKAA